MSSKEHKKDVLKNLNIAVLTVSTTRTFADDKSGAWIKEEAEKRGHKVIFYQIVPDDASVIKKTADTVLTDLKPHAFLITGGTGVSVKDVTVEAIRPLFEKELSGFSALFAQFSFNQIGSAALLSRAAAGIAGKSAVFCMPGSLNACQLACNSLIFPELGHIAKHCGE